MVSSNRFKAGMLIPARRSAPQAKPVARELTNKEVERIRLLYRRSKSRSKKPWTITRLREFVAPEAHPRAVCRALFGFTHGDVTIDPIPLFEAPPHDACLSGYYGDATFCQACRGSFWGNRCPRCLQKRIRRFVVVPASMR